VFRPGKTQDLKGEPIDVLNQTKIGLIDRKTFNACLAPLEQEKLIGKKRTDGLKMAQMKEAIGSKAISAICVSHSKLVNRARSFNVFECPA
jgi:hypothetical protein